MSINPITENAFLGFPIQRAPVATAIAREVAWYVGDAGVILGAVLFDHTDSDWGYVVLGPDENGHYRWIDGSLSFTSQDEATSNLESAMTEIEGSGKTVFPQN